MLPMNPVSSTFSLPAWPRPEPSFHIGGLLRKLAGREGSGRVASGKATMNPASSALTTQPVEVLAVSAVPPPPWSMMTTGIGDFPSERSGTWTR